MEEGQGRALLVAHSEREWDLYRSLYWTDFIQPNRPSLLLGNIESHLLAGIANGFSTEEDLSGFLSSLLSHRFIEGTAALRQSIEEALEEAEALGLAHCMASRGLHEKHWTLSSLGRVIALRGLSFETGRFLSDWLDRIGQDLPEPLTLLYAICSCGETQQWTWPRENNPQIRAAWCEEIRDRLGDEALETLGDRETLDNSLSRRLEDAAKMAMALEMWSEGESLENIQSEVTGISEGVLQSAGEGARWLLDSLGDIWRVRGNPSEGAEEIARLACSVGTGLPAWAILWNTIPSELLDRDSKLKLAKVMSSPQFLTNPEAMSLVRHEVPSTDLEKIHSFLRGAAPRFENLGGGDSIENVSDTSKSLASHVLSLDLAEEGNLFRICVNHNPIHLGIRSVELLLRLARQCFSGDNEGWVRKEDLGIDPENLSQRISDLRRRLGRPPTGRKNWIESDRKGHYRLNLSPEEIGWREDRTPPELTALLAS